MLMAAGSAASAETLLFAGPDGTVHALDTTSGQIAFRGVCSGPVSSMTVHDATLYLGDHNGSIYAYDLATDAVTGAIALDSDANAMAWLGDQLVVADSAGVINYVDPQTGAIDSTVDNINTDITAMGIDSGGLFVGGQSSLASRSHIGQDNFQPFAACGSQIQSMAFNADTMFLAGTQFFGDESGTIYLFDKFEGGIDYADTHPVASDVTAMVAANGMLYIAGSDGDIHEMDPATGMIARVFATGIDIQAMAPESGLISCPADYDASGQLNFVDISLFVDLFVGQQIPADTNGDGNFDYYDISRFLAIYTGGC